MSERQITTDDVQTSAETLLNHASDVRAPITTRFEEIQERRRVRLVKAQERLKTHLGEDNPRVIALGRAASRAAEFKGSLDKTAERETNQPKLKPNEWLVFGRVIDATGKPIPKLCVRLFDRDPGRAGDKAPGKADEPLGTAETTETGDFTIDLSKDLVRRGYSVVYTKYPFKDEADYLKAEAAARKELAGFWSNEAIKARIAALKQLWKEDRKDD